jgi:ESCRT-I complex subunit TSG101
MAGGVSQKTLSWLYDVLKRVWDLLDYLRVTTLTILQEYRDPNRTYSDLAHVLNRYPGFGPRTDVYSALMRGKRDVD